MTNVTRLLCQIDQGDPSAAEQLLPLVYEELRKLAASYLAQEKPGQTFQPTALVHEAYLRLVGPDGGPAWKSRAHFFAAAAEAMRRILVDQARRKRRPKHGGNRHRLPLDPALALTEDLIALDQALQADSQEEPLKAKLVKLRFFAGLSLPDAAACLGISPATAKRHWTIAPALPPMPLPESVPIFLDSNGGGGKKMQRVHRISRALSHLTSCL